MSTDTPAFLTRARFFWNRYWRAILLSVVVGAIVGAVAMMIVSGGADSAFEVPILGIGFGVVTALLAFLGGFIRVVVTDRELNLEPSKRSRVGADGAALGCICMWLLLGVIASISDRHAGWLLGVIPFAIVTSVIAWLAASMIIEWAERWAARQISKR
ncbi:MAG: hypothetical protein ACTJFR_07685 [Canibacter sp.]